MIPNVLPGKFILTEGLDGSGKTTAVKKVAADLGHTYIKGVGTDNLFGRLAKRFAKTFLFLLEVIYISCFPLRKALKAGEVVLMDKYFFAAASHIPDVERPINRWLIKICRRLIIKPDLIVYFTVAPEERIERLKRGPYNKFHEALINNPDWMIKREEAYADIVQRSNVFFTFLNTTESSKAETAEKMKKIISDFLIMKGR